MALNDNIQKYIFQLIDILKERGMDELVDVLKYAKVELQEEEYFGPPDTITQYRLVLQVPIPIYARIQDFYKKIQENIYKKLMPLLSDDESECFSRVVIKPKDKDYSSNLVDSENTNLNIHKSIPFWELGYLRLFLSHTSNQKEVALQLQDKFNDYAISLFVAHEDIEPTKAWKVEIKKALFSMDALIAWFTNDFLYSKWCNQEVGIAFGRNKLVIPIKEGSDPHGFASSIQAISFYDKDIIRLCNNVFEVLIKNKCTKRKMIEAILNKIYNSTSTYESQMTIPLIKAIQEELTVDDMQRLIEASKSNIIIRNDSNIVKSIRAIVYSKVKEP